ncbi:Binding-protein-dependent transporter, inner membrane component (plasmid) [Sodalis praecaptivus]|uniref:Binding-protein-dependent transporter, inner membrane component n=2 Tax=Sodalis praecaptivus TaxID=1239307 RepID=W0HZC7_9GAMM|nr:Binding-protein-dependent transporter, inner membrane component [Sodalis praecaptivus]
MPNGGNNMNSTINYVGWRVLQVIPTLIIIILLAFGLMKLAPGDMADVIASQSGGASAEYMNEMRHLYGLDVPIWQQFWHYLQSLFTLKMGYSFLYNAQVSELIFSRLPATLLLALTAILFALVLGVLLGIVAARYRGSFVDGFISVFSTIGFATPLFWIGLLFIVVFALWLRWLPVGGFATVGADFPNRWAYLLDVLHHLILPAFSLSLFFLSVYVRLTRSALLDVYHQDYVRTARAKGLTEWRVIFRHMLRNAALPIVTLTGLEIGGLLSGSVVIETVFGWPGIGRLAYDAVLQRDINLLLGIFLLSSLLVVAMNLLIDLLYVVLDPRIGRRRA